MSRKNNESAMRSFRLGSDVIEYLNKLPGKKTEIVEQAITKAHKAYSASKIWGFGSAEQINLMLSDFPEEANYANPAFEGSVVAIGTLAPAITLANEGKTLTVHMHRFQIDFNGNLLLVGGPKRNNVTKFFLEETKLGELATFDDWGLGFDGKRKEALFDDPLLAKQMDEAEKKRQPGKKMSQQALDSLEESHSKLLKLCDGLDKAHREVLEGIIEEIDELIKANPRREAILHVQKDYGLLLKAPNPLHPKNTVMIIAGCRGFGTGGAASIVADEEKSEHIIKELGEDKCKYFRAVVEVLVINDVIAKLEIIELEALDGKQS